MQSTVMQSTVNETQGIRKLSIQIRYTWAVRGTRSPSQAEINQKLSKTLADWTHVNKHALFSNHSDHH